MNSDNSQNKSISRLCENCNIEHFKRNQKYCSLKCSSESRKREHKKLICQNENCNIEFIENNIKQKYCSLKCANDFKKGKSITIINRRQFIPKLPKYCLNCNKLYNNDKKSSRNKKACSKECANILNITSPKQRENRKLNGKKGGIISASVQVRRSKAEILFADLCINYFGKDDILTNELYFKDRNGNFWDADIIIKSIKTAVLYNGIWHYKQVRKNQNLNQIQSRDKIKQNIINENGFEYYIVKDLKSFNEDFVKEEFNLFIHQLKFKKCLQNILNKLSR
jgi:hypothetical protein